MATARGTVKKTPLSAFSNRRSAGIIAVDLDEGDYLIGAAVTSGNSEVMLFSDAGKAVRFDEADVRPMGRNARGVRGMELGDTQQVIGMLVSNEETSQVLTATANGYGKRTPIGDYRKSRRGTQGVIAIDTGERNGALVAVALVADSDELMLMTTGGVLIRTRVSEVRETGRAAQGVRLINLDAGEQLVSLEKIAESDEPDDTDETAPEQD